MATVGVKGLIVAADDRGFIDLLIDLLTD